MKEENVDPEVYNPYNVDIDIEEYIDFSKEITATINENYITADSVDFDENTGEVVLTATFKNAEKILGFDVNNGLLYIEGNLNDVSVKEYAVKYTDENGYIVTIKLY